MPLVYHWSRTSRRANIKRRGLLPRTPSGLSEPSDEDSPILMAVCVGTSPSHAWSLSGAVVGERGEEWDLWQVALDDGDEVRPLPFYGYRLDELRVANPIPYRRLWLVATRTIGGTRWT